MAWARPVPALIRQRRRPEANSLTATLDAAGRRATSAYDRDYWLGYTLWALGLSGRVLRGRRPPGPIALPDDWDLIPPGLWAGD